MNYACLLASLLIFLLTACGGGGGGDSSVASTEPGSTGDSTSEETPIEAVPAPRRDISGMYSEPNTGGGLGCPNNGRCLTLSMDGQAYFYAKHTGGFGNQNFCYGSYTSEGDDLTLDLSCNSYRDTAQVIERFDATMQVTVFPFSKVTVTSFDVDTSGVDLGTIQFIEPLYGEDLEWFDGATEVTTNLDAPADESLREFVLPNGHYLAKTLADKFKSVSIIHIDANHQITTVRAKSLGILKSGYDDDWCQFTGSIKPYQDNGDGQRAVIVLDLSLNSDGCNRPSSIPASFSGSPTAQEMFYEMFLSSPTQQGGPAMMVNEPYSATSKRHALVFAGAQLTDGTSLAEVHFVNVCGTDSPLPDPAFLSMFEDEPTALDDFACAVGSDSAYSQLVHPSAPVITSPLIYNLPERDEDDLPAYIIGELTFSDEDNAGNVTLSLTGADASVIKIMTGSDGTKQLVFRTDAFTPDFETKVIFRVNVVADDGVFLVEQPITVNLTDVLDDIYPLIDMNVLYNVIDGAQTVVELIATDEDTEDPNSLEWRVVPFGALPDCPEVNCADSSEFAVRKGTDSKSSLIWEAGPKAYQTNGQNVYQVRVGVKDRHGNESFHDLRVTVIR